MLLSLAVSLVVLLAVLACIAQIDAAFAHTNLVAAYRVITGKDFAIIVPAKLANSTNRLKNSSDALLGPLQGFGNA